MTLNVVSRDTFADIANLNSDAQLQKDNSNYDWARYTGLTDTTR